MSLFGVILLAGSLLDCAMSLIGEMFLSESLLDGLMSLFGKICLRALNTYSMMTQRDILEIPRQFETMAHIGIP